MSIKKLFRSSGILIKILLVLFLVVGCIAIKVLFFSQHNTKYDVPVILSMKDLGYNESIVEEKWLKSYKNCEFYNLRIGNTEDLSLDDYEFLHVGIFNVYDSTETYDLLVHEMKTIKKNEKECLLNSNNYKNEIDIEKEFFKLDEKEWGVDKAYSLYDYNNYPDNKYYRNYIFLMKDSKAVIIEFRISFKINRSRINVLKTVIDADVFNK